MSELIIQKAVAKGIAYLDTYAPNWHARISVWNLALSSCTQCVLGQLAGKYETALASYPIVDEIEDLYRDDWAGNHGFTLPDTLTCTWPALTAEWRKHILARQAQGGTP